MDTIYNIMTILPFTSNKPSPKPKSDISIESISNNLDELLEVEPETTHFGSLVLLENNVDENLIKEQNKELGELTGELRELKELMAEFNGVFEMQDESLVKIKKEIETAYDNTGTGLIKLQTASEQTSIKGKIIAVTITTLGVIAAVIVLI